MNYYQHPNLKKFNSIIMKTPLTFSIKRYSLATVDILSLQLFYTILVAPNENFFIATFLSEIFGQASKS